MKKIRLDYPLVGWPLSLQNKPYVKQTPNNLGNWDNYQFYVNSSIEECDYWVIFEEVKENESCLCPKKNVIYITGEPPSINKYSDSFLSQFAHIISCHKDIQHSNLHNYIQGHLWFLDKDYDTLTSIKTVKKTKQISIITSNKLLTQGHIKRYNFALRLKEYFGDLIDIYGQGIQEFDDKWDVLAPYKYSIVIENYQCDDWLTEKLFDCYLSHTFPLYYGCTNISKYYNKKSYIEINIDDFDQTVNLIEGLLREESHYDHALPYLLQSKDLTLNLYNLFPLIVHFIKSNNIEADQPRQRIVLETYNDNSSNWLGHNFAKVLNWIKG